MTNKYRQRCMIGIIAVSTATFLSPFSAFADGTTSASATATITVGASVAITTPPSAFAPMTIDLLGNSVTSSTSDFVVKANSVSTAYDVWCSVPMANLDQANHVYVALNTADNTKKIPLTASMAFVSGNTNGTVNQVSVNPANMESSSNSYGRPPSTAPASSGKAVTGTDFMTGTDYRITLAENTSLASTYSDIPAGTYTVVVTANVARGD